VTRNSERECLKIKLIGQSAAKILIILFTNPFSFGKIISRIKFRDYLEIE